MSHEVRGKYSATETSTATVRLQIRQIFVTTMYYQLVVNRNIWPIRSIAVEFQEQAEISTEKR